MPNTPKSHESRPSEPRRILIIKPSSLGDIVHALPTFIALKTAYPSTRIDWLVKAQWAGLLERVEGIGHLWRIQAGVSGWLSVIRPLRAAGYDLIVDLQGLFRSGMTAWLTGSPRRVGFTTAREGSSWFYTERVAVPSSEMHAVDRYLLVASALDATSVSTTELTFGLRPSTDDHRIIAELLGRYDLLQVGRWIALSPSARWPTKRWSLESFAKVADLIQADGLGPVGIIGGPEDRPLARQILHLMRKPAADLTGSTPVGLLPALLQSAALLVSNDSGPMHVAAAVGTPVVALFGPTSATRTGPYGHRHLVIHHKVPCSPCFSRRCFNRIERECLSSIDPEGVARAVRQQLTTSLKR